MQDEAEAEFTFAQSHTYVRKPLSILDKIDDIGNNVCLQSFKNFWLLYWLLSAKN